MTIPPPRWHASNAPLSSKRVPCVQTGGSFDQDCACSGPGLGIAHRPGGGVGCEYSRDDHAQYNDRTEENYVPLHDLIPSAESCYSRGRLTNRCKHQGCEVREMWRFGKGLRAKVVHRSRRSTRTCDQRIIPGGPSSNSQDRDSRRNAKGLRSDMTGDPKSCLVTVARVETVVKRTC